MKGLSLRMLLVVSLVTALIWAFAEAESLRSSEVTVDLAFEPDTPQGRTVVDLVDPFSTADQPRALPGPAASRVSVQIEGAAEAVDLFSRRVRRGPLRLSPGSRALPQEPGTYTVPLREALALHPDLAGLGVTIRKVEPESLRVWVDELQSREFRVLVRAPEGLEGLPEPRPGVVRVTATARDLRRLAADAAATAPLEPRALEALTPGRRETVPGVRVTLPPELAGASHVSVDPPAVDVGVTVASRQSTIKLVSVPVQVRIAPSEMAKFDVQVPDADRTLIDVTVTGPAELIRQIEDKTLPIIAVVPLSFEELEKGIASKEAVFSSLPTSLKFDVTTRVVRLTITRRTAPKS